MTIIHLQDDQLLLIANGELEGAEAREASQHVETCLQCAGRLRDLQRLEAELKAAAAEIELPSAAGPRALLKAQIAELSAQESTQSAAQPAAAPGSRINWRFGAVLAGVAVVLVLLAGRDWKVRRNSAETAALLLPEPNSAITPGAAISATRTQICSESEPAMVIPAALTIQVLQLYGVPNGQAGTYEVDYLITPELGGATDVRNLWPEPYDHTVWNAHVKDQLEDRLRQMVCRGDLDLATAQRDISTDWIAAYRKYFHVSTPVVTGSS